MTELPDNVDLQWIGRTLLAHGAEFRALRQDFQSLREDFGVMALTLLRIDRNVTALRDGDLRRRVERLEAPS